MSGEMKTQGTQLFVLDDDSSPDEVVKVGNLTSIDGVGGSASDIDVTNFESQAMEFLVGLPDNGTSNFGINFAPGDESHIFLDGINGGGRKWWAIGLSDGFDPVTGIGILPTISAGEFDLPNTRTWLLFQGSLQQFKYALATNDAVRVQASIRVSGKVYLRPKA